MKNYLKFVFLIICLALFLRLFHLPDFCGFAWDQERDAFAVKKILTEKKPILSGPRVVNEQGFMLAPYFFYLLLPFYLITNLHPFAIIIFMAVYCLIFMLTAFFIIKKIFSARTAIFFIFIWAVLPLAVSLDTISWNPLLVPLLFLLHLYFLSVFNWHKKSSYLFLGLFCGISFHIHVQLLFLSLSSLVYFLQKFKFKQFIKKTPYLVFGFFISFFPLIIFDLRHHFINFNLFLDFIFKKNVSDHFSSFLPVWINYISYLTFIKSTFFAVGFWLVFLLLIYRYSHKNMIFKNLFWLFLLFPFFFALYRHRPSEYYFNFCLPVIVLTLSFFLSSLKIKNIFFILLTLILSFLSVFYRIRQPKSAVSLRQKLNAVTFVSQRVGLNPYNVSYSVPVGQNTGFNYLFDILPNRPSGRSQDPLVQIVIPPLQELPQFGDISVLLPPLYN